MARPKKTYLDMFLDNSENVKKKEKGPYFTDTHEKAILLFNDPTTPSKQKSRLFEDLINQAFKDIANRVLEMPKFHNLPKSMNKEQLIDETYFRLIEKIGKFTPGLIGKSGMPVKAFSYFSTIAKNYILEKKVRHEKILKNRADVETSIDLSILSEDTLKMMSNYDKMDVHHEDYETTFNNTRNIIITTIREVVANEELKPKRDEDFIKIGQTLEYLLEKWNKIEFMKKNEFMRILTLYTGLKQQQVSFQFKKFKIAVLKKLKPTAVSKISKSDKVEAMNAMFFFDSDDQLDNLLLEQENTEIDIVDDPTQMDFSDTIEEEIVPEKKNNRFKYGINSMEEFEMSMELDKNDINKIGMKKYVPKEKEIING